MSLFTTKSPTPRAIASVTSSIFGCSGVSSGKPSTGGFSGVPGGSSNILERYDCPNRGSYLGGED